VENTAQNSKQISNLLPKKAYGLLSVWCNQFPDKEKNKVIYEEMHRSIKNQDFSLLTGTELGILKEILATKVITTENLYDYFLNYDNIKVKPSVFDKAIKIFNKIEYNDYSKYSSKFSERIEETNAKGQRIEGFHISEDIYGCLEEYDFVKADKIFSKYPDLINQGLYEESKSDYIQKYFQENVLFKDSPFILNIEQAKAIAALGNNVLIVTRIGTGAFRVYISKILHLFENEKINSDEIYTHFFSNNQNVKKIDEIFSNIKIKNLDGKGVIPDISDSTITKLAQKIADYSGEILISDKKKFIKILLEYLLETDKEFLQACYKLLKQETALFGREKFPILANYYSYKRNILYPTLKGESVSSIGEKWIADYLYEHNISYVYQKPFYPGAIVIEDAIRENFLQGGPKEFYPTFFLPEYNIVWEHWRIDENEQQFIEKQDHNYIFNQKWEEDRKQVHWRKEFWTDWRKKLLGTEDVEAVKEIINVDALIETSVLDERAGFNEFENKVCALLLKNNIKGNEPDVKHLIPEVCEKNIDNLTDLFEDFIEKYQQNFMFVHADFERLFTDYKDDERTINFLGLGKKILELYEEQLCKSTKIKQLSEFKNTKIDFNQLLALAILKIQQGKAEKIIEKIKALIFVDFQYYSELIHKFVLTLRKVVPDVKVFAIGDDRQVVRCFGSSNGMFFEKFSDIFLAGNIKYITTNYRTHREIIAKSNLFMMRNRFTGLSVQAGRAEYGSVVSFININEVKSNVEKDEEILKEEERIKKICIAKFTDVSGMQENNLIIKVKYLKSCIDIVKKNPNAQILFLHPGQNFLNRCLKDFQKVLLDVLVESDNYSSITEADKYIYCTTINNTFGINADIVVILELNKGILPNSNLDSHLFIPFGDIIENELKNQKLLFYMGMTRAIERLYLVYEENKKSEFLKLIMPIAFKNIH